MTAPSQTQGSPSTSGKDLMWLIGIVVLAAVIYDVWAHFPRARKPLTPAEAADAERIYRSQFSSEQERINFEAYLEGTEGYRDAPIGQTRGGDSY